MTDISQLGRSVDPGKVELQARMVREAMGRIMRELFDEDAANVASSTTLAFERLIEYAKDEDLVKLYRMLKS